MKKIFLTSLITFFITNLGACSGNDSEFKITQIHASDQQLVLNLDVDNEIVKSIINSNQKVEVSLGILINMDLLPNRICSTNKELGTFKPLVKVISNPTRSVCDFYKTDPNETGVILFQQSFALNSATKSFNIQIPKSVDYLDNNILGTYLFHKVEEDKEKNTANGSITLFALTHKVERASQNLAWKVDTTQLVKTKKPSETKDSEDFSTTVITTKNIPIKLKLTFIESKDKLSAIPVVVETTDPQPQENTPNTE